MFGSLFALVLLVGATSLYLLGSLLLGSEDIGRESEHVHLEERIHRAAQDVLSAVERAHLGGAAMPAAEAEAHVAELEGLVARYRGAGPAEADRRDVDAIVARAQRLARSATAGVATGHAAALEELAATRRSLHAVTDRVSAAHAASESRQIRRAHETLRLTIAVNVAFVIAGSLLLLVSHRYFHRAIALPLRRLTERSSQIAQGERGQAMPVTSTDEIGRLSHAFNRMAEQLREHEEKLKGLTIVEERERLASELHDDLAQDLAFLRLKLVEAERDLPATSDPETRRRVAEMLGIVDAGYQNLRTAIFGLRALDLKSPGGLMPALADYLEDFRAIRKIPVELRAAPAEAFAFSPQAETQLIRIIHEALTNVVKHAQATRAVVTVVREGDRARITVEDDGMGFAADKESGAGLHFGLRTMRDRAEAIGGTLAVESVPGGGARVSVCLPLVRRGAA